MRRRHVNMTRIETFKNFCRGPQSHANPRLRPNKFILGLTCPFHFKTIPRRAETEQTRPCISFDKQTDVNPQNTRTYRNPIEEAAPRTTHFSHFFFRSELLQRGAPAESSIGNLADISAYALPIFSLAGALSRVQPR